MKDHVQSVVDSLRQGGWQVDVDENQNSVHLSVREVNGNWSDQWNSSDNSFDDLLELLVELNREDAHGDGRSEGGKSALFHSWLNRSASNPVNL